MSDFLPRQGYRPSPRTALHRQTSAPEHAYDIAWPVFANPIDWAPTFTVYMPAASATLNLPFPSQTFQVGSLVGVLTGGPDSGTLGGQSNYPNGVPVIAVKCDPNHPR